MAQRVMADNTMAGDGSMPDELQALYDRVLALAPQTRQWLADPTDPNYTASARDEYARLGFTTVHDVLPASAWLELVTRLLPTLSRVCEEVTLQQRPTSPTTLSDGAHFRRIDPHCIHNPATRAAMALLLDKLGLSALGATLASTLTPLIREIAGPVAYQRCYFYLYEEDDYISVHNDHQVGDRVDVQFPVSIGAAGGVRILSDGLLRMRYDAAGSMNLLGPRVWHEVPPLLRTSPGVAPMRFNMGFRFMPEPHGR